jgi:hypothetical protein
VLIASRKIFMREQQQTPLISAVKAKDLMRVRNEISQGSDLNAQDAEGNTALHLAIIAQHREIIQLLLQEASRAENPLNVNVLNHLDLTPLSMAIDLLDTNTINILTLRHGVDIDHHHNRELSPREQFLLLYNQDQDIMYYWQSLTMEIEVSLHTQAMLERVPPSPRTSIFHHGHTQISPVDEHNQLVVNQEVSSGIGMFHTLLERFHTRFGIVPEESNEHNQLVVNQEVSSGIGMFHTLLERFHTRLGTVPEESNESMSSILPDIEVVRPQVVDHTCCCAWWTW